MLTIKLVKYEEACSNNAPAYTEAVCVREAKAVYVTMLPDLRAMVQCGDAPGDTFEVTVGKKDCSYNVAYIMNEHGRTIETIR
jgi:hypothetical protein